MEKYDVQPKLISIADRSNTKDGDMLICDECGVQTHCGEHCYMRRGQIYCTHCGFMEYTKKVVDLKRIKRQKWQEHLWQCYRIDTFWDRLEFVRAHNYALANLDYLLNIFRFNRS